MVGAGAGEQDGVGVAAGDNQARGARKPVAQEYGKVAGLVGGQELTVGQGMPPTISHEENPLSRKGRRDLAHSPHQHHHGQIREAPCASEVAWQQGSHSAG